MSAVPIDRTARHSAPADVTDYDEAAAVSPRNAEGPDTDARPCHRERQFHTTEGKAFATQRSASAGTSRRIGDLVPAGQLLVPVMRELFAQPDALVGGDA
jgi:hypothetical protein